MNMLPPDYLLRLHRLEYEERLRRARGHRPEPPAAAPGPIRRLAGRTLVRLGVLVGGPSVGRPLELVPAHRGGSAR